jgi:hypothetical protein
MANNTTSRGAARAALEAYKASPGMVDDDETAIVDLIADLAFLAEADLDISGEYVIEQGATHYVGDTEDLDVENDQRPHADYDGEVVEDDEPLELEPGDMSYDDGERYAESFAPPAGFTGPWAG